VVNINYGQFCIGRIDLRRFFWDKKIPNAGGPPLMPHSWGLGK
jgi:hypothetical protein